MKIAIDVFYSEESAKIVAAVFNQWTDKQPEKMLVKYKSPIDEYVSGEFYKRELPCIIDILTEIELNREDVIIIDGCVYLNNEGKFGLGAHLYEKLDRNVPAIGVAKTRFHDNTTHVKEVLRGRSKAPLYVTAIGIDLAEAALHIQSMYGEYRMPDLLKLIDTETKR